MLSEFVRAAHIHSSMVTDEIQSEIESNAMYERFSFEFSLVIIMKISLHIG